MFNDGLNHHQSGRLAEAEQLYKQVLMIDPQHADTLHAMGVLARQVGRPDIAVELIRKAINLKNDIPAFYNNLGTALHDQKKLTEAVEEYKQAIAIKPDYASAHVNMGNALREQGELEEARKCCNHAIAINPNMAEAYNTLGIILKTQKNLDAAVINFERALTIKKDYVEARSNLANTLKDQGEFDAAEIQTKMAIAFDSKNADAHFNAALIHLLKGDLNRDFRQHEWRWSRKDTESHGFIEPLWDGAVLNGKTLLLHCEKGLGDSIQFIRYTSMIKKNGGSIFLLCPPALARLFGNIEDIDQIFLDKQSLPY